MDISTAKFRLYNKSPFFGSIIFNIPVGEDEGVGTMGTDGEKITYSKKFWESLSSNEKLGVLAHEIGHLYLGHLWRKGNRNDMAVNPKTGESAFLWNLAADYVVNLIIRNDLNLSLPNKCLLDYKYQGYSTEQVYNDLQKVIPKMTSQQLSQMIKNMLGNDKGWQKASGKKKKEMEGKMRQLIQSALEHQKSKGDIPAYLKRTFGEIQPKEDWRAILMDYAQPFIDDYTFNPCDRRFVDEDFAIPDVKNGQEINWIGIAVDTSGSISGKELDIFLGEVKGIMESFDKIKVKLTFCDSAMTPFIELDEYDGSQIKPVGGGGTDFRPPFQEIEKTHEEPLLMIYFTDLMGDFPKKTPDFDVLWVVPHNYSNQATPFGKVLPFQI